ncbi:hypothetical protein O181_060293 [Austropuccinia psidii MF-1]|uniref:Kinesin-like protein n=1 Tax=Austropuccinia psidii MF-1 TaxID=1389203 RepID=A0A9Q3EGA1_9BASI|nr:hypothetical protein [Austropuccinia psidii MF-1]
MEKILSSKKSSSLAPAPTTTVPATAPTTASSTSTTTSSSSSNNNNNLQISNQDLVHSSSSASNNNNNHVETENVKVIIRLRPVLQLVQPLNSSSSSIHYIPRHKLTPDETSYQLYNLQPQNSSIQAAGTWYTFDGVYPPASSTFEIYQTHISSMIHDAVHGYNSTLFAYGATGSGKSFSMVGNSKEDGIMTRAIEDVFDLIEQDQEREYVVRVSYLEIYNEQLRDLLSDHSPNHPSHQSLIPKIHEDRQGRIFVRPLVSSPCADPQDVINLLYAGESRRKTEKTEWNLHSSRSHAIFSLTLESRPVIGPTSFPITSSTMRQVSTNHLTRKPSCPQLNSDSNHQLHSEVFLGTGPGKLPVTPSVSKFKSLKFNQSNHHHDNSIRISQLNLVDLAGSEKLSDNEARNKEASYIKKSLLALQGVVSSLTELSASTSSNQPPQKHRLLHIPYRNSQLTRLLQTSLSGNAKVAFLCTISPDLECEVETLSTLRFAAGAKKVMTKAELGQVVDRATLLEALEAKVLELEAALLTNADYTEALERERDEAIERADGAAKICDDYESKLAELQTLRTPLKEQHDHLKRLILTGSPHSSYANQTTLEQHQNSHHIINSTYGTSTGITGGSLSRRKSTGRKPSRLSEVTTMPTTPSKKVSWKELFFDEQVEDDKTKNNINRDDEEFATTSSVESINELKLTIAKLEATISEAEETHLEEVGELKAEISSLEDQVKELHSALDQQQQKSEMKLNDSDDKQLEELENKLTLVEEKLQAQIEKLLLELSNEKSRTKELESRLNESQVIKEQIATEALKTKIEQEEELAAQRQLIAILEEKVKMKKSSNQRDDHDRRCSELTVDGIAEGEEQVIETDWPTLTNQTKSPVSRGKGRHKKENASSSKTSPKPVSRKRTASQRRKQEKAVLNQSPTNNPNVEIEDKVDQASEHQTNDNNNGVGPGLVRRSTRQLNSHANTK